MEINDARKNLVLVLKQIIEQSQKRLELKLDGLGRLWDETERKEKLQDFIEKMQIEKFHLTEKEIQRLHMFFSPLSVPAWLKQEEILFCLELDSQIHDEKSHVRPEGLLKLYQATKLKNDVFRERFTQYLTKTLEGKYWAKGEIDKAEKAFAWFSSLSEEQQKVFMQRLARIFRKFRGE